MPRKTVGTEGVQEPSDARGFMTAQKSRFVPKTGFNLVGPDEFHPPCEDLYLLGHFNTRHEAEAAREALRRGRERALIFGPDGE